MASGPVIRKKFGRYERLISDAYRSIYLDIDDFVEQVRRWYPNPATILEVGCGEGVISEHLQRVFPSAAVTGIDVTSRIGRLYRGPSDGVRFIRRTAEETAFAEPASFDLVVLCDVLHHVPCVSRRALIDAIRVSLAPDGAFIFKDWQRNISPIHWLCYVSDRWLTGDRISFLTRDEMRDSLAASFGTSALFDESRIGPRWNNLAILVRP
jgi:2-polyprenyl-3-methyl-5-hydroxy-6-metoxy-1,4-benzoquinol methylase